MKKKEKIGVKDLFSNGNALAILGKCRKAAMKEGWSEEKFAEFLKEAKRADFDHLLFTVMSNFEETYDDEI